MTHHLFLKGHNKTRKRQNLFPSPKRKPRLKNPKPKLQQPLQRWRRPPRSPWTCPHRRRRLRNRLRARWLHSRMSPNNLKKSRRTTSSPKKRKLRLELALSRMKMFKLRFSHHSERREARFLCQTFGRTATKKVDQAPRKKRPQMTFPSWCPFLTRLKPIWKRRRLNLRVSKSFLWLRQPKCSTKTSSKTSARHGRNLLRCIWHQVQTYLQKLSLNSMLNTKRHSRISRSLSMSLTTG